MKDELRIGIDGRPLQGKRAGIGRYIFELCRELDKVLPHAKFYVYSQFPIEMPISSERWVSRVDPSPIKKYMKSVVWLKLRCGSLCFVDKLDIFWAGATLLPKLDTSVKIVTTVYDLNHLVVPDTMGSATIWAYKLFFKNDVKKSNVVTAISMGTSKRLYELIGVRATAVILPAVSSVFKHQSPSEIKGCMVKLGIQSPYILAVATWEPRKNLELLIEAFTILKKTGQLPDHKLILAGGKGWKDDRLMKLVRANLSKDIIPLGYVREIDLPPLYAGADIFIFPSVYEGFGIPVMEARACGTRVVTTDIPELHEAGGSDSIFIQPTVEGIQKGILDGLSEIDKKENFFQSASWHDSAASLSVVFSSIDTK
jgi:glycosyltransferase involved in cell wall biosynthesis